jgi:hypothetical protein
MTDTTPMATATTTAAVDATGSLTSGIRPWFARRHTGTLAAATAVVGFALGSFGAYRLLHEPPAQPIILRQALEPVVTFGGQPQPAAGGLLVLLRNDGSTPVVVIDAAFSRTTAAPPLYVAPAAVAPGADVEVFVVFPGPCQAVVGLTVTDSVKPVRIQVSAQRPGGPLELVPVEVTGELAAAMQACGQSG